MTEDPFTRPPRQSRSLHVAPPVIPINADEFDDVVALPDAVGVLADAVLEAVEELASSSPPCSVAMESREMESRATSTMDAAACERAAAFSFPASRASRRAPPRPQVPVFVLCAPGCRWEVFAPRNENENA